MIKDLYLYKALHTWNEFSMLEMFTELSLGVAHVTSGADNDNASMSITEVSILLTVSLVTCLL